MPHSLLHSVGRGYSDFCAAMCAVGIGAREVQIWKEVDGIFTADPSKVLSARLLATVTCEEAAELTYFGSEVCIPDLCSSPALSISLICVDIPRYAVICYIDFRCSDSGHSSLDNGTFTEGQDTSTIEERQESLRRWNHYISFQVSRLICPRRT